MRKLAAALMIIVVVIILSGNAFAEVSLYKSGNIAVGAGYSGSNYNIGNVTPNSGFMVQASYFITDSWAIEGQYHANSMKSFGVNINENIIGINVVRHEGITDSFGTIASFGYGNGSLSSPFSTVSGGGLVLAVGVELKFSPSIVGFLEYRSFYMSNNAITTGKYMNDGLDAGLNVIF